MVGNWDGPGVQKLVTPATIFDIRTANCWLDMNVQSNYRARAKRRNDNSPWDKFDYRIRRIQDQWKDQNARAWGLSWMPMSSYIVTFSRSLVLRHKSLNWFLCSSCLIASSAQLPKISVSSQDVMKRIPNILLVALNVNMEEERSLLLVTKPRIKTGRDFIGD